MHEVHVEPPLVRRDLEVLDAVDQPRRTQPRRIAQRIDAAGCLADVLTAHDATFCVKLALRVSCVASTV